MYIVIVMKFSWKHSYHTSRGLDAGYPVPVKTEIQFLSQNFSEVTISYNKLYKVTSMRKCFDKEYNEAKIL